MGEARPPRVPVEIVEFRPTDEIQLAQTADVLFRAMERLTTAWPTVDAAIGELIEISRIKDGVVLVALDPAGEARGIVGGQPMYPGEVLELHPMAVAPELQGRGIGRALVEGLEGWAKRAGYNSVLLGTDDELGQTTLAGVDLYPDPLEKLAAIRSTAHHPFVFYRKLGYSIVGVIPDASGFGRPDIWMCKRLAE